MTSLGHRSPRRGAALFGAVLLAGATTLAAVAESTTTAPLHGGAVNTTRSHAFETVLAEDGIRVYLYTADLAPAMVEKAGGLAVVKLDGGKTLELTLAPQAPGEKEPTTYFCPMHPEVVQAQPGKCAPCNGMILYKQDYLYGKADLAGVPAKDVSATIRLKGLSGREKEATFAPAFRTPDRKAKSSSGIEAETDMRSGMAQDAGTTQKAGATPTTQGGACCAGHAGSH